MKLILVFRSKTVLSSQFNPLKNSPESEIVENTICRKWFFLTEYLLLFSTFELTNSRTQGRVVRLTNHIMYRRCAVAQLEVSFKRSRVGADLLMCVGSNPGRDVLRGKQ